MNTIGRRHPFKIDFWVLFVCATLIPFNEIAATPESGTAATSLLFSPSVRSNGMGQVGVALTDGLGAYYNPATPAMIAKNHFLGTVNYLGRMKVVPGLASDIDVAYNAFQVGWNSNHWRRVFSEASSPNPLSYSLAFTYYRTRANLGSQYRTDAYGNNLDVFRAFAEADNYVLSIGGHYLIDLGIGITFKNISEHLSSSGEGSELPAGPSSGRARDFGIQARFPILELIESFRQQKRSPTNRWHIRFDLSTGIAWHNRGDEIGLRDLPAYRRFGGASVFGVSWKNEKMAWDLFRFTGALERYTPQVGGIEQPGTSDNMRGFEFSFLDILDIRRGKYDDDDGQRHSDTTGYTLRSDGVFRFIQMLTRQESQKNHWFDFVANHFSICWSKFEQKSASHSSDTSHTELRILF